MLNLKGLIGDIVCPECKEGNGVHKLDCRCRKCGHYYKYHLANKADPEAALSKGTSCWMAGKRCTRRCNTKQFIPAGFYAPKPEITLSAEAI